MRRRAILVGLIAALIGASAVARLAGAQVVERVLIADPARAAHGLPPGLAIELSSPREYARAAFAGSSGSWTGPRYEPRGPNGTPGNASIDWTVSFDERQGTAEAAALARLRHPTWGRDQRGGFSVPHYVGKQLLGTVLGHYVMMTPTPGGGDARYEAVLAFPLDTTLFVVVHLDLLEPPDDSYVVNGAVLSSTWNRGQTLLALSGVRIQGNLPPKIVSAKAKGRRVGGKVVDRFLHPVVGARVALQRLAGGRWTEAASGKTSTKGFYSLRAGRRGVYRAVARLASFTGQSREVRVR